VLAVPVAPQDLAGRMGRDADEVVCVHAPLDFAAIGQFYADFAQVTDEEVVACLEGAAQGAGHGPAAPGLPEDRDVEVAAGGAVLGGHLTVPEDARGVVVFAHGSGSSRHSPRNRFVADGLNRAGLGTLLFDLLTEEEESDRRNVFDTGLLARRLADATGWLHGRPEVAALPVGYFGASTGAAAALWASTEPGTDIAAVVSRGGRPDLAEPRLPRVTAPTLLIVGGDDDVVLALNRQAEAQLTCEDDLAVVPGATHLFAEPGALEEVTEQAAGWFTAHMRPAAR
jgi:putative phosphoribosyl transferase